MNANSLNPVQPVLPPGVHEVALEAVGSTNAEALRLAEQGAPHVTLVWARRQLAGRGRDGRSWVSTEGDVFCSLLLRPQPGWPNVTGLSYVAGLSAYAAVRPHLDPEKALALKWPNDLLVDGAKLAGILIETKGLRRYGNSNWAADAVVIGTGINVVSRPVEGMTYPTSSLTAEGSAVNRIQLIGDLTRALLDMLALWRTCGFQQIRQLWLERAFGLGQRIIVRTSPLPQRQLSGIFESVDDHGHIQVRRDDGRLETLSAGDVLFGDVS